MTGRGSAVHTVCVRLPWPYRLREGMDDMTELASNGTPIDVLTEEDWETPYGLEKFTTVAEEKLHAWTLGSGQNAETGNATDWHWWAARFDAEPVTKDSAMGVGVILQTLSNGRVAAVRYTSAEELRQDWESRERHYAEYVHSECDDGVNCDGCECCES